MPDFLSRDWENKRLLTLKGVSKAQTSVRQVPYQVSKLCATMVIQAQIRSH